MVLEYMKKAGIPPDVAVLAVALDTVMEPHIPVGAMVIGDTTLVNDLKEGDFVVVAGIHNHIVRQFRNTLDGTQCLVSTNPYQEEIWDQGDPAILGVVVAYSMHGDFKELKRP